MIDPKLAYEELREATDRAVLDVLRSGQYVLGERVATFEKEVASYIGTSDAIGVSSGTEALLLALQALDVGPNDEVVTTSFSFIASATCIARLGARPVFVDIDPVTYQMDPDALAAAVSPRTRAIIAVHRYGYPAPMTRYLDIANSQDEPIAVIEDAAQAIGTVCDVESLRGPRYQKAGSIGLFGCFSFYPTKNLPACGEAGLLTTSQPYQAERARQLRVHGMDDEYHHVLLSGNGRLDALQAAILSVRLAHLDRWNQRRVENASLYDRMLTESGVTNSGVVQLPPAVKEGEVANYHQYTLRVQDRDKLRARLREKAIMTGVYYPLPLPHQPVFRELGYRPGDFPEAEKAAAEVISLPCHQHLYAHEIERIVAAIADFYGQ